MTKRNAQNPKEKYFGSKAGVNFIGLRNRFAIFEKEDTRCSEYPDRIRNRAVFTIKTKRSKKT